MQTAYHILTLVEQLKKEAVGAKIISTEFYKKERTAYLVFKKDKQTSVLAFSYHPTSHGAYCLPASKTKLNTREKPWPFFKINGAIIESVEQIGLDRFFMLELSSNNIQAHLIYEAIGPNGNLWLLNEKNEKEATLRKRNFVTGEKFEISAIEGKLNPLELNRENLESLITENKSSSLNFVIEKNITGLNRRLADEITFRAGLDYAECGELNPEDMERLLKSFQNILELFKEYDKGYLYNFNGYYEAYPFKLSSLEVQPDKYKTLSMAVMEMALNRQSTIEEQDVRKTTLETVKKFIRKLEKRIVKIEADIEEASDYENYKKIGELIQINIPSVKKGMEQIELDDIYLSTGAKIKINLDPAKNPSENAEIYFKKHRKGREAIELLKRRLEISHDEIKSYRIIYSELEDNFENASQRYKQELDSLLPKEGVKQTAPIRLPYREYKLSTGVTIFVGKDGADNDRTTFEFSKPYELWFHAQQCPGSHVVMKFPNKSFVPSKKEIDEIAAVAAFYSKAKKDTLVPVIYTERKYVRKPRKAKPGLVMVEREKSVLVAPSKPEDN